MRWYAELFQDRSIMQALQVTIAVAVIAAIIATILGTLAAIGIYSMKKRPQSVMMTLTNIPMTMPDIVTGISLMLLFLFTKVERGLVTMIMAHITFNTPYVILSVMPKLRQLDPNIFDAAHALGATGWYAFRKVILPEILPGVLNGALIAFTMFIDDFVISYFTAGSGANTLSMVVYSMVRRRISPEINALSTLMFVVVIALMILINVRQSRQDRRTQAAIRAERRADLRPCSPFPVPAPPGHAPAGLENMYFVSERSTREN